LGEEGYRRADDKAWRESVETRLITLVSAQKTADDDIDELAAKVESCDELLHGDRRERDSGIVGQLNAIESKVNSILAILHPDSTGQSGLLHEHNLIKRKVLGREKSTDNAWKFWTAVIVAALGIVGYVIKDNWKEISANWKTQEKRRVELNRRFDAAKKSARPRVTKVVPRVIYVRPEQPELEDAKPEEPKKDGVP
jgi:hypothetical protein